MAYRKRVEGAEDVQTASTISEKETVAKIATVAQADEPQYVSCLRNERVIVRHVPRMNDKITNPKHVLYGGMSENASRTFVVPILSSGRYVNVLTDSEKAFLEKYMGLEPNALSIYKKEHNFWDDSNPGSLAKVTLHKQDNYFDMSDPEDYIKVKILLANKDFVAPSLKALEDHPKATYQFVVIKDGDETKVAKTNMSNTMMCYKEFGKIEDDADRLRLIIEIIDGRPLAESTKLEFLQTKINELIQANPKTFLRVVTDPNLGVKVLIRKCVKEGSIMRKGDYYYLRSDGKPLCEDGQDPTINTAATYLNNPRHQDIKFNLEAMLNTKKD